VLILNKSIHPNVLDLNEFLMLRIADNASKKGVGNQILQLSMLRYLDRFSERANIVDESGKKFHFTTNGFKHRFGLKMSKDTNLPT
jgi:hypothetical protein